jgi:hypothetical protein
MLKFERQSNMGEGAGAGAGAGTGTGAYGHEVRYSCILASFWNVVDMRYVIRLWMGIFSVI